MAASQDGDGFSVVSTLGARMSAEERGCGVWKKEGCAKKRGLKRRSGVGRAGDGCFASRACVRVVRYTLPLKSRAAILILLVML